jgi:hypothetical protein
VDVHQLKLTLLVVLTLAALRLVSWAFLWLVSRVMKSDSTSVRLASNALGLLAFASFLVVDSVPGELLDAQALAFGVVVFGLFFAVDSRWLPRRLATRIHERPAGRTEDGRSR